MAVTPIKVYGGTLSTTLTATLGTVPTGKTWVVTSVRVRNKTSSPVAVTLVLGGQILYGADVVPANTTWTTGPNDLRDVLVAAETVTGGAATGSAIDVRISGAEF